MVFSRCDQQGNGFIGPEEFRQLCSEFDISSVGVSIYILMCSHCGSFYILVWNFLTGGRNASLETPNPSQTLTGTPNLRDFD